MAYRKDLIDSARALVMIAEVWATLPDASGHLDTETPPSVSPNRQEIMAPITFGQSAGRFAGLMPQQKPSNREVAQARLALAALGLNIVNCGFDPTLN